MVAKILALSGGTRSPVSHAVPLQAAPGPDPQPDPGCPR
jgi:hypothetical protein